MFYSSGRVNVLLNRSFVLVAEDEPFIALDLALAIEDADGQVVGPAASAQEALCLLKACPVIAAILDVNLIDGDASPIVEYLVEQDVPFIIQTGVDLPVDLAARFPKLAVRIKPTIAKVLVAQLEALIIGHQPRLGLADRGQSERTTVRLDAAILSSTDLEAAPSAPAPRA